MKLSVLIPMYNSQKYIENCLNSLVYQDIPKDQYEVIVMDDGSIDSSPAIVQKYANRYKNITLFSKKNEGAYATRNRLLKLAKGNYIYNLDADDYITHNSLGRIITLAENTNADIFSFRTEETSDLNKTNPAKNLLNEEILLYSGNSFLKKYKSLRHEVWWYMVKRDLLDKLNLKFSDNQYNADVVFTLELLLRAKRVVYFPVAIHRYVTNEMSIMRKDTFEAKQKRIENMISMIVDKSNFILNLNQEHLDDKVTIINNLQYRRDLFTFFIIIKMIQAKFPVKRMQQEIQRLQQVKAYPVRNFKSKEYDGLKYKFLNFILNRKSLLYFFLSIKNIPYNMSRLIINKK